MLGSPFERGIERAPRSHLSPPSRDPRRPAIPTRPQIRSEVEDLEHLIGHQLSCGPAAAGAPDPRPPASVGVADDGDSALEQELVFPPPGELGPHRGSEHGREVEPTLAHTAYISDR